MDLSTVLQLGERGAVVEVVCERCGSSLGRYEVQAEDGFVKLYEVDGPLRVPGGAPSPEERRRGVRGRRTGARRVLIEHHESRTYLRWRCGCGADVRRRADRIGALEATFNRERQAFSLVV